jgi:hypothetical protein
VFYRIKEDGSICVPDETSPAGAALKKEPTCKWEQGESAIRRNFSGAEQALPKTTM